MFQKMFLLAVAACLLVIAPILADELQNRRAQTGDKIGETTKNADSHHDDAAHSDAEHAHEDDHHEHVADDGHNNAHDDHSHDENQDHDDHGHENHSDHSHHEGASQRNLEEFERALMNLHREQEILERSNPDGQELKRVRNTIAMLERSIEQMHENEHGDHEHEHEHEHDDHAHGDHEHAHHDIERIEHLHIAAEHLDMAGFDDQANELRERAEDMERELHRDDNHRVGEVLEELMRQIRELRIEVRELRNEIRK